MQIFTKIEKAIVSFSDLVWGTPLLILLLGGGSFFLIYSRFLPFQFFRHAVDVLRGKYDDKNDPGDINHYEALAGALAATVGVGNISGVAVAITTGGPGAIFWMWMSAVVGMATKFFTCTLSIMYRGKDSRGTVQGGPMYVIMEGMGKQWYPLAAFFALAGMIGCFPVFQANQLTQVVRDIVLRPNNLVGTSSFYTDFITGLVILGIVGIVVIGGINRIGKVAGKLVPFMVVLYVGSAILILLINVGEILPSLQLIVEDAFTGKAVMGGALGQLIITGIRRAAFSNEAGIGTAPMMHGAAKTKEPVREGLVAMLGPFIDTVVICTMTALTILVTGVWKNTKDDGVTLTAAAFEQAMPGIGNEILLICICTFAITTLFSFSYYGGKCFGFLFGAENVFYYNFLYVGSILLGAVANITTAFSLIDAMYALMAIPTMTSTLYLAPRVMRAAKDYFKRMREKNIVDKAL